MTAMWTQRAVRLSIQQTLLAFLISHENLDHRYRCRAAARGVADGEDGVRQLW